MNKTLLVSLVSDQTIPNIQLIKELNNGKSDFLFITTSAMESKGTRRWIEATCCIISLPPIEVNQFSFDDIRSKLDAFEFDSYEKIIVNITGGTKVTTLAAYDFFKNIGAEIFYITDSKEEYLKLFPVKKNNKVEFTSKLSVHEYLNAYGFSYSASKPSGISYEQTEKVFDAYCVLDEMTFRDNLSFLHSKRGKLIKENDYCLVANLLNALNYTPIQEGVLSKEETKYLTGEWLEEYIGYTLKKELELEDGELIIGTVIKKELPSRTRNKIDSLLGECSTGKEINPNNEMDVMFMYKNKFYTVECKTSIISYQNGKSINILGNTLYKSDSLRSRFGLFANTSIITLTDFQQYCTLYDAGQQNNRIREMEEFINRANLSNIKLVDKAMLLNSDSIFNLLQ